MEQHLRPKDIFFNMALSPFGEMHVESGNEPLLDGVKASLSCKPDHRCPFTVGLSDQLGNLEFKCVGFFIKMSLEVYFAKSPLLWSRGHFDPILHTVHDIGRSRKIFSYL